MATQKKPTKLQQEIMAAVVAGGSYKSRIHALTMRVFSDVNQKRKKSSATPLENLEYMLQLYQDDVRLRHDGATLAEWSTQFFGVTVKVSDDGSEVSVDFDSTSKVWDDPKASLAKIKKSPWYTWKAPSSIADWADPHNSMVTKYAEGVLLDKVTHESLVEYYGEKFSTEVLAKSNDKSFREKLAKKRGISILPIDAKQEPVSELPEWANAESAA